MLPQTSICQKLLLWNSHPISLVVENIRLIGVNSYRLGEYEEALEQFHRIAANNTLPLGTIHREQGIGLNGANGQWSRLAKADAKQQLISLIHR